MRTAACQIAIDRLTDAVANLTVDREKLEAALNHMRICPHCISNSEQIIESVTGLTCEECQEQLPEYLLAQQAGSAGEEQWRMIGLHLQICSSCLQDYKELAELAAFANRERGVEPPAYPAPQLSFLRNMEPLASQQARVKPWHLDQLGRLVVAFSTELLRTLQPPTLQPVYAGVRAKTERGATPLWQLTVGDALEDLQVTITAEAEQTTPNQCTLVVEAVIPSRGGWPNLAGTEVILTRDGQNIGTHMTDAFGKVAFDNISIDDLPRLAVAVRIGAG